MNVVIYARFSSHSQNEQSIEGQLKTCYEFAHKQGYTVIAEYIDRALSGTTDNRPQFLKMIEDSNKKHFDGVLVYQLDRFARNRYDSATYKAKLKKNGVRVYSARENITDDASGKTVVEICDILNAQGYKTSRGVAFNKNSLRTILQNKRYIGIYTYKDKEIPDGIPRIIDDDLFYKVARIMETNKKAPAKAKAKEEYLLTTKLFCGHCKEMMRGYGGTGKLGKHYHYYACNGKIKKVCDKKLVDKDYIENLVISECRKLLTDENIQRIAREVVALCEKEQDNSNYKRLQKLLKENTRKQGNVASAIAECGEESVRKLMYEQVVKLQNERAEIEKQFAIEKASQVHLTVTDIKFFLKQLQKGKADDMRYRKTLINVFVNAIYLYDDKISFIFNSGDTPITIDDKLLSDIEADNKAFECSFLEQSAPP